MVDAVSPEAAPLPSSGLARPPLSFRSKTLFATGDAVDGIINWGITVFGFYYLTAVCGLSGTTTGAILAISIAIDAVCDPLIGSISDNTRSRWGRRLPFMLVAAFPGAFAFGLLFSIPQIESASGQALYVGGVLLLLRLSMSFYFLPYSALGAELTTDYAERSVLFAYRWFFNCFGNLVLLVLGYWVFMRGEAGLLDRGAYAAFGWTCAAIGLAAALTAAFGALPLRDRLRTVTQTTKPGPLQLAREILEVTRNRSFWSLFLCVLLFWTSAGLAAALGIHANLYFWRLPEHIIALLPLVNLAGFALSIPLVAQLLKGFEKRDIAMSGLALACIAQLLPAPLQIAGLLPEGTALYGILALVSFLAGVAGTCALVSWGSMMADAADEHEWLFGSRREALYFAGLALSFKAAAGLGGLLAGIALDLIHFPPDIGLAGVQQLTPEVVRNLGLVQGPLAAAVGLIGAALLFGYRITRVRLSQIQADIDRRLSKG
jgi:GPH family glycoside/pentoside/hexuronide:cation symporter